MFRGLLALVAVACAAVVIAVPSASARPHMMVGFLDQASTFYSAEAAFPIVKKLRAQVVRADLYWGGMPLAVARHKPTDAKDPADPAYNWTPYDHLVQVAAKYNVKILFTIWGTPRWANGGHSARYAPTKGSDLTNFAYAAATHFSGQEVDENDVEIPAVRLWTAWNEPNQLFQLYPQYKRIKGKYVMVSAINYAKICKAVYAGVHATHFAGEKVACGVTAPRGNDNARGRRGTPTPMSFMNAVKKAGLKTFDAYAHNPYNGPRELPTTKPHTKGAVHARQHRRHDQAGDEALGPQTHLADRIRVPDEPAGPRVRRVLREAGALPEAGVRDRTQAAARRHDALVPAQGRARHRGVAIRADDREGKAEARLPRLRATPALTMPRRRAAAPVPLLR